MNIREARPDEVVGITENLWLPLAREMEEVSDYNRLKDDLDIGDSIEYKRKKIESDDGYFFVAEEDELAGFASATVKDSNPMFARGQKMKLNELFVRKDFRREGLASKLMQRLEEVAQEEGCETIELDVNIRNDAGKKFYENQGFNVERQRMIIDID